MENVSLYSLHLFAQRMVHAFCLEKLRSYPFSDHADCPANSIAPGRASAFCGQTVCPAASSHSPRFDRRACLIRDLGEAMHEGIDQQQPVVWPEPEDCLLLTLSHAVENADQAALLEDYGCDESRGICSPGWAAEATALLRAGVVPPPA